jgi:hypothetical protein
MIDMGRFFPTVFLIVYAQGSMLLGIHTPKYYN